MAKQPPTKKSEDDVMKAALARVQEGRDDPADVEAKEFKRLQAEDRKRKEKQEREHQKHLDQIPDEVEVTYHALDAGDPAMTIFRGVRFKANVPVKVSDKELILSAKANPWFSVDGEQAERPETPPPREPDEQEARSADWINPGDEVEATDVD